MLVEHKIKRCCVTDIPASLICRHPLPERSSCMHQCQGTQAQGVMTAVAVMVVAGKLHQRAGQTAARCGAPTQWQRVEAWCRTPSWSRWMAAEDPWQTWQCQVGGTMGSVCQCCTRGVLSRGAAKLICRGGFPDCLLRCLSTCFLMWLVGAKLRAHSPL